MALVQRDYILRLIEAVAAAIARIIRRRQSGDLVGARQEVHNATLELLGPTSAMALMVDSRTAANLVSDAKRIVLWCKLLSQDSEILREMGRVTDAAAVDKRIVELMLESWARESVWDDDARALLLAARSRGGSDHLDAAHRAALAEWDGMQV